MLRIEAERKARKWTQMKLAWKAGISQSDVSAIEHGRKPCDRHADRLAKVLGLSVDELTQEAA